MDETTRKTLMSSNSDEWRTPPELFELLDKREGSFTLDAAASDKNHLCERYYTQEQDALLQAWDGRVFCNPPYSRGQQRLFIAKAFFEAKHNAACESVTLLIPSRTDTVAWHMYVMRHAALVDLLEGRISFLDLHGNRQSPAPFPSAVVTFLPDSREYSPSFGGFKTPRSTRC